GGAPAATTLAAARGEDSEDAAVGSDPDYTGRGRGPTAPTPGAQRPAGRSAESSANVARRMEQDTSVVALPAPRALSGRGLGETIQRRGSTRQFSHAPISGEELGAALWVASRGFDVDVPA